ncbi:MAG: DHH family phosphoesterase [Clostridia bacterium]|nr:DHH family phosphoesterase [Clostridia bacterium]
MKPFLNNRILEALKAADSIFLCTHIAPDGDAIGSLLATRLLLEGMGKKVAACCADSVPKRFLSLPGAAGIVKPEQVFADFDLAMSLDAADMSRIGACAQIYAKAPVRLQLDHHGTNPAYADENEIDSGAAATGSIIFRMLKALGQPLTKDMAACLYTAISTDTGNFSYTNADPEAFEIMAELVATGFDFGSCARQFHLMREAPWLGMLSRALSRLTFLYNGKVTMMTVVPQDYAEMNALPEHSDNLINYGMYIPGVVLCCFVNSQNDEVTKVSFRALPPYSARRVAVRLGGGGHEAAAGVTLKLPLDKAVEQVMKSIDEEMNSHS